MGQESLLLLWRRWQAAGGATGFAALAQMLGGALRNVGRHAKRRLGVRARVQEVGAEELDAIAAPEAAPPQDWCEMLPANERTWLEGCVSPGSDDDLAKAWGVHPATVSRRRSLLRKKINNLMKTNR